MPCNKLCKSAVKILLLSGLLIVTCFVVLSYLTVNSVEPTVTVTGIEVTFRGNS